MWGYNVGVITKHILEVGLWFLVSSLVFSIESRVYEQIVSLAGGLVLVPRQFRAQSPHLLCRTPLCYASSVAMWACQPYSGSQHLLPPTRPKTEATSLFTAFKYQPPSNTNNLQYVHFCGDGSSSIARSIDAIPSLLLPPPQLHLDFPLLPSQDLMVSVQSGVRRRCGLFPSDLI